MKSLIVSAIALCALGSAVAQPQVGLSIGINEPGVYGQINIGALPAPALIAPQPVLIAPGPSVGAPVYLYVPVAEQRNWRRYCRKYQACGRPVYFVREDWVRDRYAHEHPEWDRAHPRNEHRGDDRRAPAHDRRDGDRRD